MFLKISLIIDKCFFLICKKSNQVLLKIYLMRKLKKILVDKL